MPQRKRNGAVARVVVRVQDVRGHKDDAAGPDLVPLVLDQDAALAFDDEVLVLVGVGVLRVCARPAAPRSRAAHSSARRPLFSSITQRIVTPGASSPKVCAGTSV